MAMKRERPQEFSAYVTSGAGAGAGAGSVTKRPRASYGSPGATVAQAAAVMGMVGQSREDIEAKDLKLEHAIFSMFEVTPVPPLDRRAHFVHEVLSVARRAEQKAHEAELVAKRAEPETVCRNCGNRDQRKFVDDHSSGDVICRQCGLVVIQRRVHDGEMYRKFADDKEDRSHHGKPPNRLFSTGFNLRTEIGSGPMGNGVRDLRKIQDKLEMNLSNMGADDRKTRVGYKEDMKRRAFDHIDRVGTALGMGSRVRLRARELFSHFRDEKQQVHGLQRTVAMCLIAAHRDLRRKNMVKSAQEEAVDQQKRQALHAARTLRQGFACPSCKLAFPTRVAREDHTCAALSPEQQARRRAEIEARRAQEAKRAKAEEGVMMKLPDRTDAVRKRVKGKKGKKKKPKAKKSTWVFEEE